MTASTMTQFDALLKERYSDKAKVEQLMYGDRVLLGKLEKRGDTGMVGDTMPIPILYGNPQGLGGSFATAQTNQTNTKSDKFATQAGDYYGTVAIGDKVLKASRTNMGAFLSNQMAETDGLYEQAAENLSIYLWGNGGGAIGVRGSLATNTVTLATPSDAGNFEIDMLIKASANDGSDAAHALRAGSATAVTAVNASAGTVTLASAAAITSFTDGDSLFRESDFFGNTGTVVLKGVQCYVTASDTPMALWGVSSATRATQPQRYAGCRVPTSVVSNKSLDERIRILGAYMTGRFKAKRPTAGFMHPEDWQVLETVMQARGVRPLEDDKTQFGYMAISVSIGGGMVPIYADRHCPKGTFFALREENWWISSMGELIHAQNEDGLEMLRKATSTDYELRLLSYPILGCNAPKNNGRVPLT
jgi:hypothetical protein